MSQYLDNSELKNYIYEKGILTGNPRFIEWKFNIYFEKSAPNKLPGTYIFSDSNGYHVEIVGDRGGIVSRKRYKDIDELAYDVYKSMIWICAWEYSEDHKFEGTDKKDIMTKYQLDLMRKIKIDYYEQLLRELSI